MTERGSCGGEYGKSDGGGSEKVLEARLLTEAVQVVLVSLVIGGGGGQRRGGVDRGSE